jgi:hypothetical protein
MSLQLGHIILIHSQQIFALTPFFCVFSGEAANTNQGLNLKINRTGDLHLSWIEHDRIGAVMVSVLTSSAVDL